MSDSTRDTEANPPAGDDRAYVEKFTQSDLLTLRGELLQSGVDSFRAAEIVMNFLSGRGYGVCSEDARQIAANLGPMRSTTESIQAELERVARVM